MKPELTRIIKEQVLSEAADRFDLDHNSLKSLDGFENYVCESNHIGRAVVLRISHPVRRTIKSKTYCIATLPSIGAEQALLP